MPESPEPQPLDDGTNSTESLKSRFTEKLWRFKALIGLVTTESLRRGMADEDSMLAKWRAANHELLYGGDDMPGDTRMGDIILGDYHQNAPSPPKKGMGTLGKVLLGAALVASGAGGAALLSQLLPGAEKLVERVTEKETNVIDRDYDVEVEVNRKQE